MVNINKAKYHWKRRATQFAMLILIMLVPTLGLFRIDFASASFFLLDRQVEWSNYPFLFGLSIVIATAPILTYMTVGSVFCGWACPQNLFSEMANGMTHKLLGKRADVRVGGQGLVVAASKNKPVNWLILGLSFIAASAVLAFFFLMFFYTRSDMWAFLTGENRQPSMIVMYLITAFLIFIDIATVRYLYCDYPCLYRVGLRLFRSKDALRVSYDSSRSAECEKCNYCSTICITDIDPTNIRITDTCVDCGECIDACDRLHANSEKKGLLRFKAEKKGTRRVFWMKWIISLAFVAGCAMMAWGVASQKIVDKKKLMLEQQKIQRIAHVCNMRCEKLQHECNGKHLSACFSASACKCECTLELDPSSPQRSSLLQCVKYGESHALIHHEKR